MIDGRIGLWIAVVVAAGSAAPGADSARCLFTTRTAGRDYEYTLTETPPDQPTVWDGRHCAGYVVHDDKMWGVGGDALLGHYQPDVWSSSDGVNWTELPDTPWPTRHAGSVFVYDDHLWMVAGSHPGSTPINDVWQLDRVGASGPGCTEE